jgi:hypothetical protein
MHDLLEKGLQSGLDVGVTLRRNGALLFSESPERTAAIADQVITSIQDLLAAADGKPISGGIPIPELGLTATVHDGGPVSGPGVRVTYEPLLTDDLWDYHWKMTAWQIKDTVEKKGRNSYALPSILVLDVSRLGYAGQMLTEAGIAKFQEVLADCEHGNLSGVLVIRSQLASEILEALCWRGDASFPVTLAAGAVLLSSQMPKPAPKQAAQDPSWLKLVRTSAAAGNGFEGLAQVVGEGVGGGDGLPSGPDLDGAVSAGCLDEFPD